MDPDSDAAAIKASLDDPSRFGVLFDRHATIVFRFLVRRVGVDAAESLLGDVFRIAFEKRAATTASDRTRGRGSTGSRRTCSRTTAGARPAGSRRPRDSSPRRGPATMRPIGSSIDSTRPTSGRK